MGDCKPHAAFILQFKVLSQDHVLKSHRFPLKMCQMLYAVKNLIQRNDSYRGRTELEIDESREVAQRSS